MEARDFAAMAGMTVRCTCERYIVTEPVEPDPDAGAAGAGRGAYYKEDAGKMMLGAFEPKASPGDGGHFKGYFDQLPEDFDHFGDPRTR